MIEVISVDEMRERLDDYCETQSDCQTCKCVFGAEGGCRLYGSDEQIRSDYMRVFGEEKAENSPSKALAKVGERVGEWLREGIGEGLKHPTALEQLEAKHDSGKLRLSLVPRGIVEAVAAIREYGTKKYGDPDNWKNVSDERYWDAALRHMEAARNDMHSKDEESGYEHLWHVACNLAFIIAREER